MYELLFQFKIGRRSWKDLRGTVTLPETEQENSFGAIWKNILVPRVVKKIREFLSSIIWTLTQRQMIFLEWFEMVLGLRRFRLRLLFVKSYAQIVIGKSIMMMVVGSRKSSHNFRLVKVTVIYYSKMLPETPREFFPCAGGWLLRHHTPIEKRNESV